MTARREQVNAILFSVLMITSMVAGVAALGGAAAADDTSGADLGVTDTGFDESDDELASDSDGSVSSEGINSEPSFETANTDTTVQHASVDSATSTSLRDGRPAESDTLFAQRLHLETADDTDIVFGAAAETRFKIVINPDEDASDRGERSEPLKHPVFAEVSDETASALPSVVELNGRPGVSSDGIAAGELLVEYPRFVVNRMAVDRASSAPKPVGGDERMGPADGDSISEVIV